MGNGDLCGAAGPGGSCRMRLRVMFGVDWLTGPHAEEFSRVGLIRDAKPTPVPQA